MRLTPTSVLHQIVKTIALHLLGIGLSAGCLLSGMWPGVSAAQPAPLKGVVWTPPERHAQAQADLRQMHAMGVEAVRTRMIRDERLLTLADTLGFQLFQEVPAAFLSSSALRDTLPQVTHRLQQALDQAQRHPSARHFGLGQMLDTSDPATCDSIEQLARQVRNRGPDGAETYYLTPFGGTDRCVSAVDFVLVDALGATDPLRRMTRWTLSHSDVEAGIGRFGTWIDSTARSGVQVPHSAEAQSRYLERLLAPALKSSAKAVFVYRWRDQQSDPYERAYGLHTRDGGARPAAHVVKGLFTGQQTVFAFPAGREAPRSIPWLIVLGWGIISLIGIVYAREPRFRHMVSRYFRAHVFYQEAIREGRDVLIGSSVALLAAEAASLGMGAVVAAHQFRYDRSVVLALQALPNAVQERLVTLLGTPWSLGLVVGAGYALLLVLWVFVLMGASRWGRQRLTPEQAVMLVVWPRWPLLVVLIGVLVASTLPPIAARPLILGLMAVVGGLAPIVVRRTLSDYVQITGVPVGGIVLVGLMCPLLMAVYIGLEEGIRHAVPVRLVWHLLTRT